MGISVITGGLGYVGQSLAASLISDGISVIAVDVRNIPSQVPGVGVIHGTIADEAIWHKLFNRYEIDAIYHCAGLIVVSESVADPGPYFQENMAASIAMLTAIQKYRPVPIVFSSSAAIYGSPQWVPIDELHPKVPLSPYGLTKWQFEEVLASFGSAYNLPWMALRYFNVGGRFLGVKEQHLPETHLLPLVAQALANGEPPRVFGDDYDTPDGSAIRDYVHMEDLVRAHRQAADYLKKGGLSQAINLGSGRGYSVLEMVHGFERILDHTIQPQIVARRAGDPPVLIADITRAHDVLGWTPTASQDITRIIRDTWESRGSSH